MKILSKLFDQKISAYNVLAEIEVAEYENLIQEIVHSNEFQRRRVRSSKSVYSLLKSDLLEGCVIPSIFLALTSDEIDAKDASFEDISEMLISKKSDLVILDGLQRTLNILELLEELRERQADELDRFEKSTLRLEFYVGINRIGILYRMLTLNTGQTPMSLRQQIEMLYLDYADRKIDGVSIVKEADGRTAREISEYIFKDLIEGYLAYLEKSPLPIDRGRLLEDIAAIDKLSKKNQAADIDLFEQFCTSLNSFVSHVDSLCGNSGVDAKFLNEHGKPFGESVPEIFKRSQSIAGYGAALGRLIDMDVVNDFASVNTLTNSIFKLDEEDGAIFLTNVNESLLWLKTHSKKIGNAQREYFVWFFRELFNPDSDSYGNLVSAAESALNKYKSLNFGD